MKTIVKLSAVAAFLLSGAALAAPASNNNAIEINISNQVNYTIVANTAGVAPYAKESVTITRGGAAAALTIANQGKLDETTVNINYHLKDHVAADVCSIQFNQATIPHIGTDIPGVTIQTGARGKPVCTASPTYSAYFVINNAN